MPVPNNTANMRRSPLHLLLAFIAGMAVCGLIAGGIAVLRPQDANDTAPVATGSRQPDSCDATFTVVASVNQWGSLAQQLGGPCATVTSLINSTSADPHDYEPTPADLAKLSRADIVVLNGAGYDGWAEKARLDAKRQRIVNVASLMGVTADDHGHADDEEHAGHHHHHSGSNPHLWFSPTAVLKASEAMTDAYIDHAGDSSATAATIRRHANAWNADYAEYAALINKARANGVQRNYVATESIISHLLECIGAVDKTPAAYTNAVNNEAEPSPADLKSALATVSGHDVDMLVTNPQEMSGFAEKLNAAARDSHKTIVSVTEQLPENKATLLDWLTAITQQVLADDPANGWFLTQDVHDRSIDDYAGQWRSVYPLLTTGKLDKVMEAKAATGDKNADEYRKYYETGYRSKVESIAIDGDSMTFMGKGGNVTAAYRYDGYRILDYPKGNRGVRYLFTAVGDVPDGAPKVVQFSDHGISPGHAAHFHIFIGDSHDEVAKEMDHWPTYYPSSMSDDEIVREMLAH